MKLREVFFSIVAMIAVIFLAISNADCAQNQSSGDQITLSTYYPAPHGDYDNLSTDKIRLNPRPDAPNNAQEGDIYYSSGGTKPDGSPSDNPKGVYICVDVIAGAPVWQLLGEDDLTTLWDPIGQIVLSTDTTYDEHYGYYDPIHDAPPAAWVHNKWSVNPDPPPCGSAAFYIEPVWQNQVIIQPFLATPDTLPTADYRFEWGGGQFRFTRGTQIDFYLMIQYCGVQVQVDHFALTNPGAIDGTDSNGNTIPGKQNNWDNTVRIPLRIASYRLYKTVGYGVYVHIGPYVRPVPNGGVPLQANGWETDEISAPASDGTSPPDPPDYFEDPPYPGSPLFDDGAAPTTCYPKDLASVYRWADNHGQGNIIWYNLSHSGAGIVQNDATNGNFHITISKPQ
ncbi:hypothetical protein ACFL0T_03545 [Candidatus Omnitrophota bacterium]